MSYSIETLTADCYEGTTCLINKFGIISETQLEEVEANITMSNTALLEKGSLPDKFDIEYYKSIHRFLFQDLYDWAGEFRTVNISKKGTKFCEVNEIEKLFTSCFARLEDLNYFSQMNFDDFIENIVDLYCTLNIIHPFREGNGRTERIFIAQIIRFNDYDIDFSNIDPDSLMIATIQSAQGINDSLISIFKNNVKHYK